MANKYTRSSWNCLLTQINNLNDQAWGLCTPFQPSLPLVGEKHRWSVSDVVAARNRLQQICKDNVFTAPLTRWSNAILDELDTAINSGWCDCDPGCQDCVPTTMNITQVVSSTNIDHTTCSEWVWHPGYWIGPIWIPGWWEEIIHDLDIKTNHTNIHATINNVQLYTDTRPVCPGWRWRWHYYQVLGAWERPICEMVWLDEEFMLAAGNIFNGKCSTYNYSVHHAHRPTEYRFDSGSWLVRPHHYELRGWCQWLP